MQKDIAIIGMAGRFPGAGNLQQLYSLLAQGKDSVGSISAERINRTTLDPQREYMTCGYLEDIDVFDHQLFNISAGEAQTMDPHLRLLLEVAYETIENAAYATDQLKGSNTAVFIADASLEYYKLAETFVPTLASGNTKAFLASMLSRQFDLRGNALTVDTTCSSSLLAVHLACNELILGDADLALAGGANLYLFPYKEPIGLDLDAPDGRSKAFSAQANGMSHGEAVACVLLKRLDKALADGDIIHAVIKGSAVNCNAGRSASITAPDSEAQAEVIRTAWKKAGIDLRLAGYMEAHGSGTVLGDNIEVGGFTLAFNDYTDDKQFCPIGTIKSNIGHTRSAAGIAGLLKTVLSLQHKELFPNIHFEAPHPQINFQRSAVFVNSQLRPWLSENGPRYAGVSSIGLSGTNCHMVLEEAPAATALPAAHLPAYLLPVSAQTPEALVDNVKALLAYFNTVEDDLLPAISYTLWQGRKHYEHRVAISAAGMEQACEQLYRWLESNKPAAAEPLHKLVFILDEGDNTLAHYQSQYDFYKWLEARGISTTDIMAANGGRYMVAVIKGEITLAAAWGQLSGAAADNTDNLPDRVAAWLQRETEKGRIVLVNMGRRPGALSQELQRQAAALKACTFVNQEQRDLLVKVLYEQQAPADWEKYSAHLPGKRIPLPGYQFCKKRSWLRELPFTTTHTAVPVQQEVITGLAGDVKKYWKEILQLADCRPDDNFFELGGDSIKATQVINRINTAFGLRLDFEDLFDYPTIAALTAYIEEISGTAQKIYRIWKDVLKQEPLAYDDNFFELGGHSLIANQIINRVRQQFNTAISFDDFFRFPTIQSLAAYLDAAVLQSPAGMLQIKKQPLKAQYEVSHAQKRLWILSQSPEGAIAYNQPGLYKVSSPLNMHLLEKAFEALIDRHEILRTTFTMEGDELLQTVLTTAEIGFTLQYYDYREHTGPEAAALAHCKGQAARHFDLHTGPLLDALVIQTGSQDYIILLNLHHIITDGWSNGVLIHDLLTFYRAFAEGRLKPLPPLEIQYKDYAAWQNEQIRNGAFELHKQYWLQQFSEPAPPLGFPSDFTRPPVKSYQGRIHEFVIDNAVLEALNACALEHNATLFMVLLTGLYVLLYRFSGQHDITIGTSLANRDHVDLENQMGFYVNTLAIRTRFHPELTFAQLLQEVKENTLQAYEHGVYPFDLLVDDLQLERDMSRTPLFDIMLTLQNMENSRRYNAGTMQTLEVESIEPDIHISKFDLLILVSENNGQLDVLMEYDTALIKESTIEKVRDGFISILQQVPENPPVAAMVAAIAPASQQEKAIFDDFIKAIQDI